MSFNKTSRIPLPLICLSVAFWMWSGCSSSQEKSGANLQDDDSALITTRADRLRVYEGGTAEVDLRLKN
ncbi:MAG TPA: hypothetical protein VMW46_07455, partial [Candidatus Desulfaltia sp.]|nr:hypothetical protein [Candidatus Desulfaltia sp.]